MSIAPPAAPPRIFSPSRRRALYARALARQSDPGVARYLYDLMREEVEERLSFTRRAAGNALVMGDPTGTIAVTLRRLGHAVDETDSRHHDEEQPHSQGAFDLIVAPGWLATVNDLPGALFHLRAALRPGGLLIAGMVGAGSLPALRAAMLEAEAERPAARTHPSADNRAVSALLQRAGFAGVVTDETVLNVRYPNLVRLVADLRDHGATSALADAPPFVSREAAERAASAFARQADADGRVTERFVLLTLTGWC